MAEHMTAETLRAELEDGSRGSLAATPTPWWINDGESLFARATATIIHAEGE